MRPGRGRLALVAALACAALARPGRAGDVPSAPATLEEPPRYGLYYDRPEPSFYTGFAPRTVDPRRLHLHLGRGNQLRVTVVLADEVIVEYARDLRQRERTYRALVDGGRIVLTQNRGFEEFERTLAEANLDRLVAEEKTLSPETIRERNLALLEHLNPGRVFRIRVPVDDLVRRWLERLRPEDRRRMEPARRLELVNLLLPTRLWVAELEPGVSTEVEALVRGAPEGDGASAVEAVRPAYLRLLDRVGHGMYPVRDGRLEFVEFTALYPVGTFNEYTSYRGRQIPTYPTPGRRALTTHQRTKTVDHVPTDESYSYFPWLPYMHVGTNMHNSVHTLWWKMETERTPFLPAAWRTVERGSRDGTPYRYLWLLSRGPMSHGCTHLNAGHISELRQLLPSETERLYEVDTYLNSSTLYDVFDIEGDGTPEVMGVRYFIAYRLKENRPDHLRVRNERRAYYDWLYAGELEYDGRDGGVFPRAQACRFVGRQAIPGAEYERIALHEADYEPERIQFYRLVDIPFARELRKVSVHHPFPGLDGTTVSIR
jgi:hypothetical protein